MTTLRMIVKELEAKGYNIKYYLRKDGSLVIQEINGESFKGKTGNLEARRITGQPLSEARKRQLERIQEYNARDYKLKPSNIKPKRNIKKPQISTPEKEINNQIRRINRRFKERGLSQRVYKRQYNYHVKNEGQERAKEYIDKIERYSLGYAYRENIEALRERIELLNYKLDDSPFNEVLRLFDLVLENRDNTFRDEYISEFNNKLYEIEKVVNSNAYSQEDRIKLINEAVEYMEHILNYVIRGSRK